MSDSGFDPGLADPARAGVFFVTEDDLGPLAAVGRDAGLLARRIVAPGGARPRGAPQRVGDSGRCSGC